MKFQPFGDEAVLINFEQKINLEINSSVIRLKEAIENSQFPEFRFCIPAYCSLTVGFDPSMISYQAFCKKIDSISTLEYPSEKARKLNIPVCYEGSFALDFKELREQTQLSTEEIIRLHTTTLFRVYMLGFLPGFPYMGKLPDPLFCKRKSQPRLKVPAGSVGLAGYQTGIYPSEAPGGWQIIGRTALTVFDAKKSDPFLFKAGDEIQFQQIPEEEFEAIKSGKLAWKLQI